MGQGEIYYINRKKTIKLEVRMVEKFWYKL